MTKSTGMGRGNNPASRSNPRRGAAHYRWATGGIIISTDGYVKIRVGAGHPLADPNGYAYEHLIVWASAGRPLPGPGELLHHASEDKTDNRLGNLELLTRAEHNRRHNAERQRDARGRLLPTHDGVPA